MNFGEALDALKKGKKVKRSIWGGYWFFSPQAELTEKRLDGYDRGYSFNNGLIVAVLKDMGALAPAMPYQADLLAEDWQIIE